MHPEEVSSSLTSERENDVQRFKMIDAFISMLSHDLRNPLSSVHMNAALLLQDIPPGKEGDKARQRVASMQRSVASMTRMISALLDVNLINAGKLPLRLEMADAADDVLEVIDEFIPIASYKERILDVHVPDRPLWVKHDKDRIRQVLGNLVSNAIRYSPIHSTIRIVAEKYPKDPSWIQFRVYNDGYVIPDKEHGRIFDRYTQFEDGAPRSDPNSVGLGLWIARWLVGAHNGKIWVESKPEGNEFCFIYPRNVPSDT